MNRYLHQNSQYPKPFHSIVREKSQININYSQCFSDYISYNLLSENSYSEYYERSRMLALLISPKLCSFKVVTR